jgi:hypothetical protein
MRLAPGHERVSPDLMERTIQSREIGGMPLTGIDCPAITTQPHIRRVLQ